MRKFLSVVFLLLLAEIASAIRFDRDEDQMNSWMTGHDNGLKEWSVYNYSSDYARKCKVTMLDGKTYDPLSFKGEENDEFAIAFHLSTEVAVSAAQTRNGTLIDVAKVEGNKSYKALMSQIQHDLKGDRSSYYSKPEYYYYGFSYYTSYLNRLAHYALNGPPPPLPTDPTRIFKEILLSLKDATESSLSTSLNTSSSFYGGGNLYMYISAPWELNHTFAACMRRAMNSIDMNIHYHQYGLQPSPYVTWHNHSNDQIDYSGENGTAVAFEQARKQVEMMELEDEEYGYRYGDFVCGTWMVEEDMRIEREMRKNGTWVDPPRKASHKWRCGSWKECWKGTPEEYW